MINDCTRIDFSPGVVEWMEDSIQEDMLQVIFPNKYILDMGWYNTLFKIFIIHDNDWVNPVYTYSVDKEDDLIEALSDCKKRIINLIMH